MKIRFGFNFRKFKVWVRKHHIREVFWMMVVVGLFLMVYGIVGTMEYRSLYER